jgi:hypothetical protein
MQEELPTAGLIRTTSWATAWRRAAAWAQFTTGGAGALFFAAMVAVAACASITSLFGIFLGGGGGAFIMFCVCAGFVYFTWKPLRDTCVKLGRMWRIAAGVEPGDAGPVFDKSIVSLALLAALAGYGLFSLVHVFAGLINKEHESCVLGSISSMREAIKFYASDNGGKFPADLQELTLNAKYISSLPVLRTLKHHEPGPVLSMSGEDFRAGKFTDTGGWAYVNSPGDRDWGRIVVNCLHSKETKGLNQGQPWTTF